MEVRDQLPGVCPLLPSLCGFQELKSGDQACGRWGRGQTSFPVKPFPLPKNLKKKKISFEVAGAGEMTRWLTSGTTFAEDLNLVTSTHTV